MKGWVITLTNWKTKLVDLGSCTKVLTILSARKSSKKVKEQLYFLGNLIFYNEQEMLEAAHYNKPINSLQVRGNDEDFYIKKYDLILRAEKCSQIKISNKSERITVSWHSPEISVPEIDPNTHHIRGFQRIEPEYREAPLYKINVENIYYSHSN